MSLPVVNSINDLTIKVGQTSSSLQLELYDGFQNLIETVNKSVDKILFNMEIGDKEIIRQLQFQSVNYTNYSEKILKLFSSFNSTLISNNSKNQILNIEYYLLMLFELSRINENTNVSKEYLKLIVDSLNNNEEVNLQRSIDAKTQNLILNELKKINLGTNYNTEYLDLIVDTMRNTIDLEKLNQNTSLSVKYLDFIGDSLKDDSQLRRLNQNTSLATEYLDVIVDELKSSNNLINLQKDMSLSVKYLDFISDSLKDDSQFRRLNQNTSLNTKYLDFISDALKDDSQLRRLNQNTSLNTKYLDFISDALKDDTDSIKLQKGINVNANYLELIVDALKNTNELKKINENTNLTAEYLDVIVGALKDSNQLEKEKFAFEKLQAIKAEEDRIEQKSIKEEKEKQEPAAKEKGGFLSGILLAIAGIVTGFVVGFVDSLRKTLSFATKVIKNGFFGIINLFKNTTLFKTIQFYFSATISTIVGVFKNIYNLFAKSNLFQGLKSLIDGIGDYFKLIKSTPIFSADDRAIVDIIKKIASNVKSFFMNILRIGDAVGEVSKIVVATGGKIVSAFQTVKTFVIDLFAKVGAFFKNISGITTIFGKIGIVLGKIFFPITVLLTLFDTIKGAIEGFKEEGIIGGIKGALSGFLASVVGVPLDLLKNLLSWLAEKLGFENVSKTLDSFNFVDLIKSGVKGIFQFFQDLFTDPLKAFGLDKPTELLQKAGNVFKSIFGGIVEFLASIAEFIPIKGKDIAESIRKFKPEETTATPTPSGGLSGAEVQVRSQEVETQKTAAPIVVTNAPTTINAPTNTSMNSTTAMPATSRRIRPSPIESDYRDPVLMGA